MRHTFISIAALLTLSLVSGCNTEKNGGNIKLPSISNLNTGLAAKGSLCGQVVSVNTVTSGSPLEALGATMQMAICGDLLAGKTWKALGLTVHSSSVYLHQSGSSDYNPADGVAATLMIDSNNVVYAVSGTKTYTIGQAVSSNHGAIINATNGADFEMAAGDQPYVAKDGKNVNDAQIWVGVQNLAQN